MIQVDMSKFVLMVSNALRLSLEKITTFPIRRQEKNMIGLFGITQVGILVLMTHFKMI